MATTSLGMGQRGRQALLVVAGLTALAMVLLLPGGGDSALGAKPTTCKRPSSPMTFAPQTYVDTERAGGEPTVEIHPDGTLLYGGHAGTTHFYTPEAADEDTAAFFQHYRNQTYIWWSDDNGATWNYVPRDDVPNNMPGSGFSDPDFAIDTAGQVYASEINLANVAVSKSTDSSRSYSLQNFFAQTLTDRQWTEADEKDVLYIVGNAFAGGTFPNDPAGHLGHTLYKSTDGGETFSAGVRDNDEEHGEGLGDLQVDKSDGTLYEAYYNGDAETPGTLSMVVRPDARGDEQDPEGDLTENVQFNPIAENVRMLSHWPSFDLDSSGNLYIVWDESGREGDEGDPVPRPAGVWFAYSTDRGRTWSEPAQVDAGPQPVQAEGGAAELEDRTDIWPWLAAGDDGRVAVAWLEADKELEDHDAEIPGDHGWRVIAAQTRNGHGCGRSATPGFRLATATPEPVHTGTICQGGTTCQAELVDRRMGDYFSIEIDATGRMWAGYSDTRRGGAVALPGFVRQDLGPRFLARQKRP